jgi:hypothetical protein
MPSPFLGLAVPDRAPQRLLHAGAEEYLRGLLNSMSGVRPFPEGKPSATQGIGTVQPRAVSSSPRGHSEGGRPCSPPPRPLLRARWVLRDAVQVTVWGWILSNGSESPQAVSFSFPSGEVTVGIGYSARTMVGGAIGDGDELLVWDEPCWRQQLQRAADGSVLTPLCHLSEEAASHR